MTGGVLGDLTIYNCTYCRVSRVPKVIRVTLGHKVQKVKRDLGARGAEMGIKVSKDPSGCREYRALLENR